MRPHHWLLIAVAALLLAGCGATILTAGLFLFWTPPDLEGQMEMSLPGSGAGGDAEPEIDASTDVVIIVRTADGVNEKGLIGGIVVQTPRGRVAIPAADWRGRLVAELRKARQESRDAIKIEADRRLKWANIVEIMDACKEAGFTSIGFAPPPDE